MNTQDIQIVFKDKHWEKIATLYSAKEVAKQLGFKNGMRLAYRLLYNDAWDDKLQRYSIHLLYALRKLYKNDWEADWRNDAFLGSACNVTLRYDERYEAYRRAYNKANPPAPELLIELARCCICPGDRPVSYDEAIKLLERSIKIHPYIDAIALLKGVNSMIGDNKKAAYWDREWKKMEEIGEKTRPPLEPDFVRTFEDIEEHFSNFEK